MVTRKVMNSNLPLIYGFNKASEIGPDILAPCIFLKGCNLRCPYCMNAKLVDGSKIELINIEEVKKYVLEEKSQWVLISGGEPTNIDSNSLINLITELKSWGCKIGMATNGNMPDILEVILPLLNYVALDIKCADDTMAKEIEMPNSHWYLLRVITTQIKLAGAKLKIKDFDYEVRTTLYPPLIDKKAIHEIGSLLRKDTRWVLQQFRHSEDMLDKKAYDIRPYGEGEVKKLLEIASIYCNDVQLRYV
jgi:pyruvate formate lyase activating enzyme